MNTEKFKKWIFGIVIIAVIGFMIFAITILSMNWDKLVAGGQLYTEKEYQQHGEEKYNEGLQEGDYKYEASQEEIKCLNDLLKQANARLTASNNKVNELLETHKTDTVTIIRLNQELEAMRNNLREVYTSLNNANIQIDALNELVARYEKDITRLENTVYELNQVVNQEIAVSSYLVGAVEQGAAYGENNESVYKTLYKPKAEECFNVYYATSDNKMIIKLSLDYSMGQAISVESNVDVDMSYLALSELTENSYYKIETNILEHGISINDVNQNTYLLFKLGDSKFEVDTDITLTVKIKDGQSRELLTKDVIVHVVCPVERVPFSTFSESEIETLAPYIKGANTGRVTGLKGFVFNQNSDSLTLYFDFIDGKGNEGFIRIMVSGFNSDMTSSEVVDLIIDSRFNPFKFEKLSNLVTYTNVALHISGFDCSLDDVYVCVKSTYNVSSSTTTLKAECVVFDEVDIIEFSTVEKTLSGDLSQDCSWLVEEIGNLYGVAA